MGLPWFSCEPVEESFFDSAPMRLRAKFEIPRPAEEIWTDLTGDDALSYCRILQDVSWTSPRPFGVDTTRTVKALWGSNTLEERYFIWDEEARRHAFMVERTTSPLFRSLAEDYLVEPTGESACRFTWTIAVAFTPLGRLGAPLNRALLKSLFTDTARHYGLGSP